MVRNLLKDGFPEGVFQVELFKGTECVATFHSIEGKSWIGCFTGDEESIFTNEEFLEALVKLLEEETYKVQIIQNVRNEITFKRGVGLITCVNRLEGKDCNEAFITFASSVQES